MKDIPDLLQMVSLIDLNVFRNAAQACSNFKYGDVLITVDATDFSKVSYENLAEEIVNAK
ncbi:MAG: hypothetical protein FH761_07455 [Firmicutes bacterium]|nr:hypothetical protein [Bacillota bacterium]